MSFKDKTLIPVAANARIAGSRPAPGPFRYTSIDFIPASIAFLADSKIEFPTIADIIKLPEIDLTFFADPNFVPGSIEAQGLLDQTLAQRFGAPPFSILDARQGYWQIRKAFWIGLGIQSEVGRGDNLLKFSEQAQISVGGKGAPKKSYQNRNKAARG